MTSEERLARAPARASYGVTAVGCQLVLILLLIQWWWPLSHDFIAVSILVGMMGGSGIGCAIGTWAVHAEDHSA